MTIQRLLLVLFLLVSSLEAFTSVDKRSGSNTRLHSPDRLQYANAERSLLFTNHQAEAVDRLQYEQLQLQTERNRQEEERCQVANYRTPHPAQDAPHSTLDNRHAAADWMYNLKTLHKSSVLRDIRSPVLTVTIWSAVVSVLQRRLVSTNPGLAAGMCIPHAAHSFVVSSLGLLLVFRTNSAYQRFVEGRKIWEEILNVSRNFSRMATLYRSDIGSQRLARLKNLLAAYPYLLRHHVRSGCLCQDTTDIDPEYRLTLLDPAAQVVDTRYEGDKASGGACRLDDISAQQPKQCQVDCRQLPWNLLGDKAALARVARSSNRPLLICDQLAQEVMRIPYSATYTSRERLNLLSSIDKLSSTIGQSERIHQTAVPLNYARHALRSLTLWLLTLPFCLVKDFGFFTGPVTGIMAWLLFGVYQIGHSIENPFQGSLRLSILCNAIRKDVLHDSGAVEDSRESALADLDESLEEDSAVGRATSTRAVVKDQYKEEIQEQDEEVAIFAKQHQQHERQHRSIPSYRIPRATTAQHEIDFDARIMADIGV